MPKTTKINYNKPVETKKDNDGTIIKTNIDGNILYTKDSNKSTSYREYDDAGKLIYRKDYDKSETYFIYYPSNKLHIMIKRTINMIEMVEYDKKGNMIKHDKTGILETKSYSKNNKCVYHQENYPNNKKIAKYNDDGVLIYSLFDGVEREYDDSGRIVSEVSDKNKITYAYNDNGYETTESYNDKILCIKRYDLKNRLLYTKDCNGTEEHYRFDDKGNMIYKFVSIIKGNHKEYTEHDILNNRIKYNDFSGHERYICHDNLDNKLIYELTPDLTELTILNKYGIKISYIKKTKSGYIERHIYDKNGYIVYYKDSSNNEIYVDKMLNTIYTFKVDDAQVKLIYDICDKLQKFLIDRSGFEYVISYNDVKKATQITINNNCFSENFCIPASFQEYFCTATDTKNKLVEKLGEKLLFSK